MLSKENDFDSADRKRSKKILTLSTYESFPCIQGGQIRVFNVHRILAREFEDTILCNRFHTLNNPEMINVASGIREISYACTERHLRSLVRQSKAYSINIADVTMPAMLKKYAPDYMKRFLMLYEEADILFLEQPYLVNLIPKKNRKPVVYNSQNVEFLLKETMLKDDSGKKKLLSRVKAYEQRACDISELILCCSQDDADQLARLYGADKRKIALLPNCTDSTGIAFLEREKKQQIKMKPAFDQDQPFKQDQPVVVFIGSSHQPNMEAGIKIMEMARSLPHICFCILGRVGDMLDKEVMPCNLHCPGMVEETVKKDIFSIADIAINPMISGSGTNLKIAEYMCYSIPVITTEVGARGFELINGEHAVICDVDSFTDAIKRMLGDPQAQEYMRQKAYKHIVDNFNWEHCTTAILPRITALLD